MRDRLRRAVFLDKDGTLVEDVPYNVDPARLHLMPGAVEALRELRAAGFRLIVITNQSGLARRIFTESALASMYSAIDQTLAAAGVALDGFYHCPHLPPSELQAEGEACRCRKPEPGLLYEAAMDEGLYLNASWFVGDIADDIEAGRRAGCRTVLITPDPEGSTEMEARPDFVAHDLAEAAAVIIRESILLHTLVENRAGIAR